MWVRDLDRKYSKRKRPRGRTADGDVGQAAMAAYGDGIGEEAKERLGDHGQVGGGLEDLQRGGGDAHAVLEEETDAQPREEPEALHPEAHPDHQPPPRRRRGTLQLLLLLLLHDWAFSSSSSSRRPGSNQNLDPVASALLLPRSKRTD